MKKQKVLLIMMIASVLFTACKEENEDLSVRRTGFLFRSGIPQRPRNRIGKRGRRLVEVFRHQHFGGVVSVADPLWMTNYELIYDHPELMIDWYAICGNHEYRGNTQAVLDYVHVSRRWNAPARYYTRVITAGDGASVRLVFIDTTPLMDKYRNDTFAYPDACRQDAGLQLQWIDSVLVCSTEEWKVVIGHHPVYAETKKEESERADLQARLAPILEENHADVYFCGHIHNFQHIRFSSSRVNYVVNSAGSLARPVKAMEGTQFCSGDAGFTLCSADAGAFRFFFINAKGETIYRYAIGNSQLHPHP